MLVEGSKVDAVIRALTEQYYAVRHPELDKAGLDAALLLTEPAGGACVYATTAPA